MTRLVLRLGGLLMTLPLLGLAAAHGEEAPPVLADFPDTLEERPWVVVNDNVMGGRSRGGYEVAKDRLVFQGATNTDGGGFSSIRSQPRTMDLSAFDGIRIRARGDGRTYILRLTTSTTRGGRYQPSYWASFATEKDRWTTADVPFSSFRPRWRGRWLDGPELEPRAVETVGLMIYDGEDGPFRLEVDRLEAYRAPAPFSMRDYVWKKRPLVLFAPTANDARLLQQLAAIEETREGFEVRDMVRVVVLEDGLSRAGERELTAEDARRLRAVFGVAAGAFALRLVGKDGGVKRRSDATVPVQVLYDQIDAMPMRRAEMRGEEGDAR